MPHDISLITTIAAALVLALIFGLVASRLRLPPLVGYLLAGIMLGPGTPGFVADLSLSAQLAEIGVMLLMFGVGLHFSLDDLLKVRRIAIPGAIVQIIVATLVGFAVAHYWAWPLGDAIVFGLCLSVASTVVLIRALEARGELASVNGQIAVGWLIVEDLVMVLVLVLLPAIAGVLGGSGSESSDAAGIWQALAITCGKILAFVVLMLVVGKRLLPKFLWIISRSGSRELFTLCVIATAVGVAFGAAELFGVSFALGAFFAGMVLRESEFSHQAAENSLPLRDAFSVLFFVSVGMLLDPMILIEEPVKVLITVGIIMLLKTLAAMALVLILRYPLNTALIVGASLAQIGEFSFILAGLGVSLGMFSLEGQSLVLAGAIISIALNSALFSVIDPLRNWVLARSAFARHLEQRVDPFAELPVSVDLAKLSGQVVLVGYGRVGRLIAANLDKAGISYVVAERNRELVEKLRTKGILAVSGDATEPSVLIQAHIARASMLVIAVPDTLGARVMIDIAKTLNPTIEMVLRTHSEEEAELFRNARLGTVFLGENELAKGMTRHLLERYGHSV
jgi:CPA2 family monovalent cation:H+ antiporter-2